MRVISGNLKGRALLAPKARTLRPTSDQVKETLFNIIAQEVPFSKFLDLFAGTGNIGIEALSRNAEQAVFVEKQPAHVRILKRNLAACGVEDRSIIYHGDANKLLGVVKKTVGCVDIIFLDPPYHQTRMLQDILKKIVELSLLAEAGIIVVEHAHTFTPQSNILQKLELTKSHRIGNTILSFYRLFIL